MQDTVQKPFTRRESLGYAQVLLSLLLLVAMAAVVLQFATPRPQWVDLGSIDEPSDVPIPRTITRSDGTDLFVWVVHIGDEWFVFDASAFRFTVPLSMAARDRTL